MLKQLRQSLLLTLFFTLLLGLLYPFMITKLAGLAFPFQAHGSLIRTKDHGVRGSIFIGQNFSEAKYFHPRPSATAMPDPKDPSQVIASPYNPLYSGGSNNAATNKNAIRHSIALAHTIQLENPRARANVPIDLVTASGSGLDPDISVGAAEYQVERVAVARGYPSARIQEILHRHITDRSLGIFGERIVNVLELNMDLDKSLKAF